MKAMATNQNITWFMERFDEENLELNPDFQRNPVWIDHQKDYLIETILLEMPIPEIYYVSRITSEGKTKYIIVDGQQRLRTIIEFTKGDYTLKTSPRNHAHVKQFSDLTPTEKQRFWRYPIVIRDLEDSNDDEVRELFQRLNKYPVSLNEQELRNARYKGHFLKTVEKISDNEFWTSSGLFSANDIRRMLDLEFISILLCTIMGGIFNRKDRLEEFYTNYEEEFEESGFYVDRFNRNLDAIDIILSDMKKRRWRNKADFYTLFLYIDEIDVNADNIERLKEKLTNFESMVIEAKNEPDTANEDAINYLDAVSYGSNDKEKRHRRYRILKEVIKLDAVS